MPLLDITAQNKNICDGYQLYNSMQQEVTKQLDTKYNEGIKNIHFI